MSQKFENLSAVMDGEIDANDDLGIIHNDPELSDKWQRYHLTRDILRNDHTQDFDYSMSARIAKAIEQELPIVAPQATWRENPVIAAVIPIFKQTSQLAAAACVTAMVIFGYQSYNQPEEQQPFIAAPSQFGPMGGLSPVSLQQGSSATSNRDQARMAQLLEQRRQLNAVIEDHERQLRLKQAAQAQEEQDISQDEQP